MAKRRTFRNKDRLASDQEQIGGKILKAFRSVDESHSSLISGTVADLADTEDIPAVKTTFSMRAFILDPRLMHKEFNRGFIAGAQIGRIAARVGRSETIRDDGYKVGVDEPRLAANRKTVLLSLRSEELEEEMRNFRCILGQVGVKGFTRDGQQRGHRSPKPEIVIANFMQPVSKANEAMIIDAIDTSLAVHLSSVDSRIDLGELQIKSYRAN